MIKRTCALILLCFILIFLAGCSQQGQNINCENGKLIEEYVNPMNAHSTPTQLCLKDELSCTADEDCSLGENCGYLCYNKEYSAWYEQVIAFCEWDYPTPGTTCKCINNFCEVYY